MFISKGRMSKKVSRYWAFSAQIVESDFKALISVTHELLLQYFMIFSNEICLKAMGKLNLAIET